MFKPFCHATLAACGLLILGACDSSTGPRSGSAAQIARHIDSLAIATRSLDRYEMLYLAERGPSAGVGPAPIVITTASGPQQWSGYIMRYVTQSAFSPGADSTFDLVAYSDYSLTNVLWVHVPSEGGIDAAAQLLMNDSLVTGGLGTATIAIRSVAGGCRLVTGLEYYPSLPAGACSLATFIGSASVSVAGASPELQTISIATQTFPGLTDALTVNTNP